MQKLYRIKIISVDCIDEKYIPQKFIDGEWKSLNKTFTNFDEAEEYINKLKQFSQRTTVRYVYI